MWGSKKDKNLPLLRAFRDQVLVNSGVGRDYLFMIYHNSLKVLILLIGNPSLTEEVKEVIDELLPKIELLLDGGEMVLSKNQLAGIESLLARFETKANSGLKMVIKKIKKDIIEVKVLDQLKVKME